MVKRYQCVGGPWDKHIIHLSTGETNLFRLGMFEGLYRAGKDKNAMACYWVSVK